MNVATIDSNTLAVHNGRMIEDFVSSLFPGIQFCHGLIDAKYRDNFVEVKSCQRFIRRTDCGGKYTQRSGRFVFDGDQHKELLDINGEYFFFVQDEGVPTVFFMCSADQIGLKEFSGTRSVAWTTIARRVI